MPLGVMEVEIPTIVVIRNISPTPYIVRHNKRVFTILPHSELHLPWDAAASFLGDPRVIDVGRNHFRRILYDQVRAMNNFYLGFDTETRAQADLHYENTRERKGNWEDKKPPVEVYTIDNQRIFMLVDDPAGTLENPWGRTRAPDESSNTQFLEQQIARLQEQQNQLMQLLVSRDPSLPSQLSDSAPTSVPIVTNSDVGSSYVPSSAPNTATGRPPQMTDGIRDDLLPLQSARIPSPDELFSSDSTDSASTIPSADPSSAVISSDSPKSTKPVASSSSSPSPTPKPKSKE